MVYEAFEAGQAFHVRPEVSQGFREHRGRGDAIDVEVAEDGYRARFFDGALEQADGFFDGELAPFGGLTKDECNRPETTIEALRKLPPVFDTTSGQGSVTAGNSSQLSDGASSTLVMSNDRANKLKLQPLLLPPPVFPPLPVSPRSPSFFRRPSRCDRSSPVSPALPVSPARSST